jgi:DNA-binding CsgD family transcriptional regulator
MSSREDRLADLIGEVYDAALDPGLWTGMAPKIAAAFEAPSAGLVIGPALGSPYILSQTANITDKLSIEYEAHYHQHDVWAKKAMQVELSSVYLGEDLVLDAEFERSEYYQDWCSKTEAFYLVGSVIGVSSNEIAIFGVHRSRSARRFDHRDRKFLECFLPHVRRALQLRQRLSSAGIERDAAFDALERSGTATLVVGADGAILHASRDAEGLLRQADGIRTVGRRLAVNTRTASERLTALIRETVDTAAGRGKSHGGALSIVRAGRLPLTILVAPFRAAREGFGAQLPSAILFIRDPEHGAAATEILQSLFGLTPAEAAIASALAQGKTLDAITAEFRISLNTARTHLKTVFAKTATTRQAELVALLLRSVAMFRV